MPIASLALVLMTLPSVPPPDQVSVPPTTQVEATPIAAATNSGAPDIDVPAAPPSAPTAEQAATAATAAVAAAAPTDADASVTAVDDGDLIVTARSPVPGDPMQAVNAASFNVTQVVDNAVTGPVAHAFERTVPTPVRSGLRNLLSNLHEPVVFINFLLQHKIGKAMETLGRFAINSTIGIGGVMDVAQRRPFHLPRRPNGFADTLGFYGVGPGPFLYVPLVGPTTLRDLVGRSADGFVLPNAFGSPFNQTEYSMPTAAFRAMDSRAESDERIRLQRESNADPYASARDAYLRDRRIEIDRLRCGRDDCRVPAPIAAVDTSHPRR